MGGAASHPAQGDSRVVQTKYGAVIGRRFKFNDKEVDAFQGIPFAKPPLGELRFKKSVPPEPWEGVKETKAFGPRGIQKESYYDRIKYGKTSEDNLYLNVFTPVWGPELPKGFSVLVFVHGGGFVGDGAVKYGDSNICEHLCTKDVVVVTIQYRLGYLGFFTTGDAVCPGNFALWDQTMALQWVQDNISAFNGNPNSVTVMGQSAGGASVDILSLSPHSRDLFHQVIPMAGNASCSWGTDNDMVERCRKFAETQGILDFFDSEAMIAKLRQLPESKFELSMHESLAKSNSTALCAVAPRVDGDFIPKPIRELRKEAVVKPMLIGCCDMEGIFMTFGRHPSLSGLMEEIAKLVPEEDHPSNFKKLRRGIFQKVLKDEDITNQEAIVRAYTEIMGDLFTNIGVQQTVLETLEAHHAPIFLYSFNYFNPKSWGPLGMKMLFKAATHCTELGYIFGVGIIWNYDFNDDDKKMLELTTKLWTNFVKYGNPNGVANDVILSSSEKALRWEPATITNPQRHLSISLDSEMREEYKNSRPLLIVETRMKRNMQVYALE
ncbi:unnamed protein product [Cylicocyclus nassatus]|uniref:Carboxylesterase type B domain-containing protein n=1 Tax=Cylicocyclus nassatus TaxID=53992 RepID=A0AA36GSU3_CYLNA|nr:unnamed protein product [Cylicocyclus nassatus]